MRDELSLDPSDTMNESIKPREVYRMKTLRSVPVYLGLSLLVFLSSCGGSKVYEKPDSSSPDLKRIAVAQVSQETNSFSTVPTTIREFESSGLYYGDEIIEKMAGGKTAIAGALQAVADLGEGRFEVVPILRADAMSGGSIERAVYRRFRDDLQSGLREAGQIDGVYLVLHGAMGVEGMRDPEGDLLEVVRSVVGPDVPMGVSHDLHANITEKRVELADFIVGYKTNPHRDHFKTGYHTTEILVRTIQGKVHPVMAIRKIPMLVGGGMEIDFLQPMRRIFRWMKKKEKDDQVLALSNFMVHIWMDDEELGWTTIAVTDGDAPLARKLADELAMKNWEVKDVPMPERLSASQAIALGERKKFARIFGPLVVCDSADAVGAGAPGENTWFLKELLDSGTELTSYLPLRDVEAARTAWAQSDGDTVNLTLGGKLDPIYNRPVEFSGIIERRYETAYGKTLVLRNGNIHVVLTELATAVNKPSFYKELGFKLWKADLVVVKNLFPFRYFYLLYNRGTLNVETPGTTSVNIYGLKYEKVPRPIHPLDQVDKPF
jgi:microcystin degradation protein MlrC